MVKWAGFKTVKVDVIHNVRADGKTSYSFKKMARLALDIILAFSDKTNQATDKVWADRFIFFVRNCYQGVCYVVKRGRQGIRIYQPYYFNLVFVGYYYFNSLAL